MGSIPGWGTKIPHAAYGTQKKNFPGVSNSSHSFYVLIVSIILEISNYVQYSYTFLYVKCSYNPHNNLLGKYILWLSLFSDDETEAQRG